MTEMTSNDQYTQVTETDVNTEVPKESHVPAKIYKLPSQFSQLFPVYAAQMRLYAKSAMPYLLIFLAALIPILSYIIMIISDGVGSLQIYEMLQLMSFMIVIIPAVFAGRILSSEFKNRTAYLTFPLPVSRNVFFAGKFLAALTLSFGIMLLAYGLSIVTAEFLWNETVPEGALASLLVCLAGTFAIGATAYALSTFFRRGSLAATILLILVLPIVLIFSLTILSLWNIISESLLSSILEALTITPMYAGDVVFSLLAPSDTTAAVLDLKFETYAYAIVSIIWGILFLLLGLFRINRKEL